MNFANSPVQKGLITNFSLIHQLITLVSSENYMYVINESLSFMYFFLLSKSSTLFCVDL